MSAPVFKAGQKLTAAQLNALSSFAADQRSTAAQATTVMQELPPEGLLPTSLLMPSEVLQADRLPPGGRGPGLYASIPAAVPPPDLSDFDPATTPRPSGTVALVAFDATTPKLDAGYLYADIFTDPYGSTTDISVTFDTSVPVSTFWDPATSPPTPGHIFVPLARIERNDLLAEDAEGSTPVPPSSALVARNLLPLALPQRLLNAPIPDGVAPESLPLIHSLSPSGQGRTDLLSRLLLSAGLAGRKVDTKGHLLDLFSYLTVQPEPDGGWTALDAFPARIPPPDPSHPETGTWNTVATLTIRHGLHDGSHYPPLTVQLQAYQALGSNLAFRFNPPTLDLTDSDT